MKTFTKEQIDKFRKDFLEALLKVLDRGKPCLTQEQAQHIVDSYSDGDLAYDMQYHTAEELADINTM